MLKIATYEFCYLFSLMHWMLFGLLEYLRVIDFRKEVKCYMQKYPLQKLQ